MSAKFTELPEGKRLRIVNAGFEVFGCNPYRRASTDLIAAKAGISKGLLFYYFRNKKELYLFLFDFACERVAESVTGGKFDEITDFFELCDHAAQQKYRLLEQSPYLMEFLLRAYDSQTDGVSDDIAGKLAEASAAAFDAYCARIDRSKFRDDVDPREILSMLVYLADGRMREVQRAGRPVDFSDLMDQYRRWCELLKRISYREEYLL